eukprot:2959019-Pyramimonas_sp.AAC.1
MLHQRLIRGGAEARTRDSQFGFRPRRGAADALMLVWRMIDAAHNTQHGVLILLMLDGAKAFDRLKIESMYNVLRRFGFLAVMVDMLKVINPERFFTIFDRAAKSKRGDKWLASLKGA